MIKFEKVSYEQFKKDSEKLGFKPTREVYDSIKLPVRSTSGSAGYDFVTPYNVELYKAITASEIETIPTGIRVILPKGYFLMIAPRSGLGFKTGMHLANTMGIIDCDYYKSDNEGHIMAKFVRGFADCEINAGERCMQGIIMKYEVTDDDSADVTRNGGFGSTGV